MAVCRQRMGGYGDLAGVIVERPVVPVGIQTRI